MKRAGGIFNRMPKLFHPSREQLSLDAVLAALGDPIRLEIVARLGRLVESPCGGLGMELPKSTASHHFKVLREAGLVRVRLEGTARHLSLRRDDLQARFPGLLESVLASMEPAGRAAAGKARGAARPKPAA